MPNKKTRLDDRQGAKPPVSKSLKLEANSTPFDNAAPTNHEGRIVFDRTQPQRRLDYLAKFLTIPSMTCVAVTLKVTQAKTLVITTNQTQGSARTKNTAQVQWIQQVLHYFLNLESQSTEHQSNDSEDETTITLLVEATKNKINIQFRNGSVPEDIKKSFDSLPEMFKNFLEGKQYDNLMEKRLEYYDSTESKKSAHAFGNHAFIGAYASDIFNEFLSIKEFFEGHPSIVQYKICFIGGHNVHAEMRLLCYLILKNILPVNRKNTSEETTPEVYFGITLLCCFLCWETLQAYSKYTGYNLAEKSEAKSITQEESGTRKNQAMAAGTHGLDFPNWELPANNKTLSYKTLTYTKNADEPQKEIKEKEIKLNSSFIELHAHLKAHVEQAIKNREAQKRNNKEKSKNIEKTDQGKKMPVSMSNSPDKYSPHKNIPKNKPYEMDVVWEYSEGGFFHTNKAGERTPTTPEQIIDLLNTHHKKMPYPRHHDRPEVTRPRKLDFGPDASSDQETISENIHDEYSSDTDPKTDTVALNPNHSQIMIRSSSDDAVHHSETGKEDSESISLNTPCFQQEAEPSAQETSIKRDNSDLLADWIRSKNNCKSDNATIPHDASHPSPLSPPTPQRSNSKGPISLFQPVETSPSSPSTPSQG